MRQTAAKHPQLKTSQTKFNFKTANAGKTVQTTAQWLKLLIHRYTFLTPLKDSMGDICNCFHYTDTLSSSGQPTQGQLSAIKDAGYTVVINLATTDVIECPIKDEAARVTGLGMQYFHIPVDFFNPTQMDYENFTKTMQAITDEKIWVHCSANARASSFLFKYRTQVLGVDRETALWDLREIWEPFGPWKRFVYGDQE